MPVVNGYATTAELREHLGDASSKLTAALLERAINAASRAVDNYTGRRFWQDATTKTRLYCPCESERAYVDDISTTTGLVVATDPDLDGSFATTWLSTDYQLSPLNADQGGAAYAWTQLEAVGDERFILHERRATLRVTARFGWSAVPDEVTQATILKASRLFRRKETPLGIQGFDEFGAVRITRNDSDVIELLSTYVKVGV